MLRAGKARARGCQSEREDSSAWGGENRGIDFAAIEQHMDNVRHLRLVHDEARSRYVALLEMNCQARFFMCMYMCVCVFV